MILAIIYLLLITLAEALVVFVSPQLGVFLHSCLLIALLLQGATARQIQKRRFLLVMALVPLIRIISTTLPLGGRPLLEWHIVIGALLFVAIYFTVRAVQLDPKRIGITTKNISQQFLLGLLGIPFGLCEYLILKPTPLISSWSLTAFLDAALILLVFTGLLEEVIFRGLMQEVTTEMMGFWGVIYSSAVFMVLHLGYKSIADLVFVFGVAILFSMIVVRTHSIIGISLAHGWINIFLYLIFPLASLGYIRLPGVIPPWQVNTPLHATLQPTKVSTPTPRGTPTAIAITPQSIQAPSAVNRASPTPSPSMTPMGQLLDPGLFDKYSMSEASHISFPQLE
jgi:membrane protease YdiL (CAAX protease family)